jgi:hypothetical protein
MVMSESLGALGVLGLLGVLELLEERPKLAVMV